MFDPVNVEATIATLADAGPLDESAEGRADVARRAIDEADRKLERHRAALEAGADAQIVAAWMAETSAQRLAAERALAAATVQPAMTPADVRRLDRWTRGHGRCPGRGGSPAKGQLYADLGIQVILDSQRKRVTVTATPGACTAERVGGGT